MNNIIDLPAEAFRRERYIIVMATAVYETIHSGDPEDPTPLRISLLEVINDIQQMPLDNIELQYRFAVAFFVAKPGAVIYHDHDPTPHHRDCLKWSRDYLIKIGDDFGIYFSCLEGRR